MTPRNASFHEGVLAGVLFGQLKLAFAMLLGSAAVMALAWTIDWVCVFRVWPEGIEQLRNVLATDLANGIELARRQGRTAGAITGTANFMYEVVFQATGIHEMGLRFAELGALSLPDTIVRNTYIANQDAIEVAMIGTQLLGVRVATLALMLPLVILLYLIATADGLSQRAIRRASGGRESASLHHRAKYLQAAVGGTAVVSLLVWPAPVDWILTGFPMTGVLGGLARTQWTYFKKYM